MEAPAVWTSSEALFLELFRVLWLAFPVMLAAAVHIVVIRLDALRVTGIQHFDSAEKLAEALAKLPVD